MTRVTSEIRIDAPREKVWDVIADLGSVSVWNPLLADSHYTSEAKEGLEAARHCDFPDGGYVKEFLRSARRLANTRLVCYRFKMPSDLN